MPAERLRLRVTGTVQGVGFRPFVYRLAREAQLRGWVRNDARGVTIEVSGDVQATARFADALASDAPPAARVDAVTVLERGPHTDDAPPGFVIVPSEDADDVTTDVSPDLPVCDACLRDMRDPTDRRYRYPFVNCTDCGPRYSIVEALPYDRPLTTMRGFTMCNDCAREYHDPNDRRFHAQPVACPRCGPRLRFVASPNPDASHAGDTAPPEEAAPAAWDEAALEATVRALREGRIVAVKGLGGYHLACDAHDEAALRALRERKFRKEKPFAVMARDLAALDGVVVLNDAERALLASTARPIVLARKGEVPLPDGLAPDNASLGVMLPYTPVHHLLFDGGAPALLVMTSANRSSEPIAYRDDEALARLAGLADAFLIGQRPIARRVDDSVAQVAAGQASVLRRARGYAPAPVVRDTRFERPSLALGAELKNAVTLAVGGAAYVSQHLGDLGDLASFEAFQETVHDLCAMYRVDPRTVPVAHDLHPAYPSTRFAMELGGPRVGVQHHEAHIASVLAERGAWEVPVLGFAFDGAGLGHDGTVWGGEVFHGSLDAGLTRVAHLRPARLPGGDAAARTPVQAAVGWLEALGDEALERVTAPPFDFPAARVNVSRQLIQRDTQAPVTTSVGRLFDTVAALTGFAGSMSFEGQAAIWLEAAAWRCAEAPPYPWPFDGRQWDHVPLLQAVMDDVANGTERARVARRFHESLAQGILDAVMTLRGRHEVAHVVLSGGVFQNRLLLERTAARLARQDISLWWNRAVPANDGGISLGQSALAAMSGG
ncbi:MAG: carbamoyltransferase HypF [Trueperaceae bacterium]|nr:carbamoyltransferase HypF [Trueperaceae bacterium]